MLSNKRHLVIELAVILERFTSKTLCHLLDIDIKVSKAFGNGRSSLSFANKLSILSDLKTIEKKDKLKFDYFSEIRNQFAHNQDAVDYSSCFDFIDMENKLLNLYKNDVTSIKDRERKCERLFGELFKDLSEIIDKLLTSSARKNFIKGEIEAQKSLYNNLIETLKKYSENDKNLYKKMSAIFTSVGERTRAELNIPKSTKI